MKYTKVRSDAFQTLQMNAGIIVDTFDPATGTIGNILGATTGGFSFTSNPTYTDFGEDIDNVPANTYQLKHLQSFDPQISGTFLTVTATTAKKMVGPADVDSDNNAHVVPRNQVEAADFSDIWVIGDYSDKNTGADAGFIAIHLMKALNTAGIQWTTTKDGKGQFAFEFHGHYDLADIDTVPFEIYVKSGSDTTSPYILLDRHNATIEEDETLTLHYEVVPAGTVPTWSTGSSSVATVAAGVVTGEGAGNTIITASITVNGVTYTDTCTIIVPAAD